MRTSSRMSNDEQRSLSPRESEKEMWQIIDKNHIKEKNEGRRTNLKKPLPETKATPVMVDSTSGDDAGDDGVHGERLRRLWLEGEAGVTV
ncbi:hypothetical protein SESBI_04203 [Sesbania bispinosa]|nr:hypothetical protein SESBI_04203 [Sesbania bispinosa]